MTIIERGVEYEDEDAEFFPDGAVRDATLAHDATIQGLPCAAGRSVVFYESGRLKLVWLSRPAVLDGIPCPAGQIVFLHENGGLMNSELGAAHDFAGLVLPAGTRVTLDEIGQLLEYSQSLSADQRMDGVPCASLFNVWRYPSAKLSTAVLAAAVEIDGQEYQRGTELWLGEDGRVIRSQVLNVDFSKKYKHAVCGVYEMPWE